MSDKPVIFISHSSKDGELARLLKQQIESCFSNGVEVFAADIDPGENWFNKVMGKLNEADAIVVLITPNSVRESHWVWFELGYFWAQHDDALKTLDKKKKIYYPLYATGVEWPNPVKDLQVQAAQLTEKKHLEQFFKMLCKQFPDGHVEYLDFDTIENDIKRYFKSDKYDHIPTSKQLISQSSNGTLKKTLEGDELETQEIIREWLHSKYEQHIYVPASLNLSNFNVIGLMTEERNPPKRLDIFGGRLIYFNTLDTELKLVQGQSKKYLKVMALEFDLVPVFEGAKSIRFQYGRSKQST